MTLKEYKTKYRLTLDELAEMTGKHIQTISRWCNDGAIALVSGRTLLAVRQPSKPLWESEAYIAKSENMGVNQ